jgi:hypothetical protein
MSKLLGSMTMIAALALAGTALACGMHDSASTDQSVTTASAANPPPATTTTTTKQSQSGTGG